MRWTLAIAALASCAHPAVLQPKAMTAASAWAALVAHHRAIYLRGGAECHRLVAGVDGRLVRAADPAHQRPRLAFAITARADGAVELASEPPAVAAAAVISCRMTYTAARDIPIGLGFEVAPPADFHPLVPDMPDQMVASYTERDCLAEPAPDGHAVDCLRGVLDSTSELPDAVVDRLAGTEHLYRTKDGQCETLPLHTGGGFDVHYTGYAYEISWWTADELNQERSAVVQLAPDRVLLGGQPAYVDRCR